MPHGTIAGMSESGKTFWGQNLAQSFHKLGRKILVLHKELEPWPLPQSPFVRQTEDPELFLWMFWKIRDAVCFIEMGDAEIDRFDIRFHRCFTKGRHAGHRVFFLTQYPADVHPRVRSNCHSIALFNSSPPAAKIWANEFNDSKINDAASVPQYHCIFKPSRFQPAFQTTLKINENKTIESKPALATPRRRIGKNNAPTLQDRPERDSTPEESGEVGASD